MIALVRHGQTAKNRDGHLQGRVDPPLTDEGRAQAERLGAAFAVRPVARVIASPLERARATAAPIAFVHGVEIAVDERLVELDYGEWDQRGLVDVTPDEWARWRADPGFAPPGGESLAAVGARIASFLESMAGDDLIVAVSHVSPIKAAVCLALGVDLAATWRMHLDLASITRIGARGPVLYLASYNETV
ncbi:MAG: histidine phosphatase family protein [Actinomycetota bacterium]